MVVKSREGNLTAISLYMLYVQGGYNRSGMSYSWPRIDSHELDDAVPKIAGNEIMVEDARFTDRLFVLPRVYPVFHSRIGCPEREC